MKKVLITTISSKGQVVIPNEVRKTLKLESGTPLAVFTDGTTLLLKPVEIPSVDEFENLLADSKKAAKAAGLKQGDLKKVIKKVRHESRS
jgi:AbrB family looped-hinge helix DNA binding protein